MCSMQLSLVISGDITARFSLKIPNKQIDSIEELVDSKMSLIVYPSFMEWDIIQDKTLFKRLKERVEQDKTIIQVDEMYRNKTEWIVSTSEGKAAMFLPVVPLKMIAKIHSKHLNPDIKFHLIHKSHPRPILATIASSTRLPKQFRTQLNLK